MTIHSHTHTHTRARARARITHKFARQKKGQIFLRIVLFYHAIVVRDIKHFFSVSDAITKHQYICIISDYASNSILLVSVNL